jgi:hypothetical protein
MPGLDLPSHPGARFGGVAILALGYCYIRVGLDRDLEKFYPLTVHARFVSVIPQVAFILMDVFPGGFVVGAVIELGSALWTAIALRSEGKDLLRT